MKHNQVSKIYPIYELFIYVQLANVQYIISF